MVCGEDINVAIKNKPAISVQWKVPLFLCGNAYLSYRDIQGSISRRVAIFRFEEYFTEKDLTLKDKIITNLF